MGELAMTGNHGRTGNGPSAALQRLVRRASAPTAQERCEFCAEPIPAEHRHLLDVGRRQVLCVCRACSLLFSQDATSEGKYRLIPDRRLLLAGFRVTDPQWQELQIPVGLAFLAYSTPAGRVTAWYPGAAGAMEGEVDQACWEALRADNPVLEALAPDVEALLVNRVRGARQYFLTPIDECFRLVAVIRTHWRGFTGGSAVWPEVARFFEELEQRSRVLRTD